MRDIVTRHMKGGDSSLSILFYSMIFAVLTGGVSLPVFGFNVPNWSDTVLFATAGIMVCVSHLLIIQALLFAPGATVAPFKYLSLVYAAGIGYIVWGDVPNIGKIIVATLVVFAGLFILHREMNAKKSISWYFFGLRELEIVMTTK